MRMMKLMAWMLTGTLLAGCANMKKQEPIASPVPTAENVASLRARYTTQFPSAKLGVLTAVLNDGDYATVSEIDPTGLKVGDILFVIDANENHLADAHVAQIANDKSLTITFTVKGPRRPAVGDVAVKF